MCTRIGTPSTGDRSSTLAFHFSPGSTSSTRSTILWGKVDWEKFSWRPTITWEAGGILLCTQKIITWDCQVFWEADQGGVLWPGGAKVPELRVASVRLWSVHHRVGPAGWLVTIAFCVTSPQSQPQGNQQRRLQRQQPLVDSGSEALRHLPGKQECQELPGHHKEPLSGILPKVYKKIKPYFFSAYLPQPLFEVTNDPSSHPQLHRFLKVTPSLPSNWNSCRWCSMSRALTAWTMNQSPRMQCLTAKCQLLTGEEPLQENPYDPLNLKVDGEWEPAVLLLPLLHVRQHDQTQPLQTHERTQHFCVQVGFPFICPVMLFLHSFKS